MENVRILPPYVNEEQFTRKYYDGEDDVVEENHCGRRNVAILVLNLLLPSYLLHHLESDYFRVICYETVIL